MTASIVAGIAVASVLPGAFFYWGFERRVGAYGISSRDRYLRIAGASAVFLAAYSPGIFWLSASFADGFAEGRLWPSMMILPVASTVFLGFPPAVGYAIGAAATSTRDRCTWWSAVLARFMGLEGRTPTAWENTLNLIRDTGSSAAVRCRLQSGQWIAGAFAGSQGGVGSYASTYPEERDIYLSPKILVDRTTGEYLRDGDGNVKWGKSGVWISRDRLEIVEWEITPPEEG